LSFRPETAPTAPGLCQQRLETLPGVDSAEWVTEDGLWYLQIDPGRFQYRQLQQVCQDYTANSIED
jgi:hypothetical protein